MSLCFLCLPPLPSTDPRPTRSVRWLVCAVAGLSLLLGSPAHLRGQPVPDVGETLDLQQAVTVEKARAIREIEQRLPQNLRAGLSSGELATLLPDSGRVDMVVGSRAVQLVDGVLVDSQLVSPAAGDARLPQVPQDVAVFVTDSVARSAGTGVRASLPMAGAAELYTTPYRVVVPVAGETGRATVVPVFWTQPERLQWNRDLRRFETTLRLAVADTSRPDPTRLGQDIVLYLSSDADSLRPDSVVVSETNRPAGEVRVAAEAPGDSLHFAVNAFRIRDTGAWIRTRPALLLEAPSVMEGLGVEERSVTVRLLGRVPRPGLRVPVSVTASAGSLEPDSVILGPRPAATLRLRSGDLGSDVLEARAPGVDPDRRELRYRFPVFFILASVVGGVLGGAAKAAAGGPPWGRSIVYGGVLGVFAAVAYFILGVSVLSLDVEVPFFNHGAVLALSAVGAYSLLGKREEAGSDTRPG